MLKERETETEREKEEGREEREEKKLNVRFLSLGTEWPQFKTEDEDSAAKETKELLEKQEGRELFWLLDF